MILSHKKTFFENIGALSERDIVREIQRLKAANERDAVRFSESRYRAGLVDAVGAEKADRIMMVAMAPYRGEVKTVSHQSPSGDRKAARQKMKSRRQSR